MKELIDFKGFLLECPFETILVRVVAAEGLVLDSNCTFMTVSTMDREALPFYLKTWVRDRICNRGLPEKSKIVFL
ncbi:MAG: hypothetical protein FJZ61_06205 [Chlamydiae bacterium]|nr:hypothetical protein [Chlamydiota bacterium]